jgi:hypothetical protein
VVIVLLRSGARLFSEFAYVFWEEGLIPPFH